MNLVSKSLCLETVWSHGNDVFVYELGGWTIGGVRNRNIPDTEQIINWKIAMLKPVLQYAGVQDPDTRSILGNIWRSVIHALN